MSDKGGKQGEAETPNPQCFRSLIDPGQQLEWGNPTAEKSGERDFIPMTRMSIYSSRNLGVWYINPSLGSSYSKVLPRQSLCFALEGITLSKKTSTHVPLQRYLKIVIRV